MNEERIKEIFSVETFDRDHFRTSEIAAVQRLALRGLEMTWRGMDSAPKDARILIATPVHGGRTVIASWDGFGECWVDWSGGRYAANAWMPLPLPPAPEAV